jgi:hypothetical protein
MTKHERVRYEMFLRVRDFGTMHRDRFPEASKAGQMFAHVADAVAQIEAQGLARLQAVRGGRAGKAAARKAMCEWMLVIGRAARDVARTGTGLSAGLRLPKRRSDAALVTAARLFLETCQPVSDELIQLGLSANWVSELTAAIDAFEDRRSSRRAGRYGVSAARAAIDAALDAGFDALHTLDVVVTNTLKDDPVLTAAWRRARAIVEGRPTKDAETTEPVATAETPAPEPEPEPADVTALPKAS